MSKQQRVGKASVSVQRWLAGLAVVAAPLIGACADQRAPEPEPEAFTARIVHNETGEIRDVAGNLDTVALAAAVDEVEKAGCVHIRFCTATFFDGIFNEPNTVVCDTNDQACSSNSARFSECNGDATAVCGKTRPMGFDPAIPCPLSGIPTSVCPSGWSLVWYQNNSNFTIHNP